MDTHGFFLRSQIQLDESTGIPPEEAEPVVQALARGDLHAAPVPDRLRALLRVVETITRCAYRTSDEDIQVLRDHGWTEPQIAEMVYDTAMFAFFNRVADAFGIDSEGYGGPRPAWDAEKTRTPEDGGPETPAREVNENANQKRPSS